MRTNTIHHFLTADGSFPKTYFSQTANYILTIQESNGSIPWETGNITDPWDHIEAAMGLSISGEYAAARKAFQWLIDIQREDGAWLASYKDGAIVDGSRAETNFVAYVATGLWHYYLITKDKEFLAHSWPMVNAAIKFVLGLQSPEGEIYWALDTRTGVNKDALVTGCSSIYKSLECTISIARELGHDEKLFIVARAKLGEAIRFKPERFDRTWESKARYSMDWFYPILTGVYTQNKAAEILASRWHKFIEPGLGCRCVADQPWVTIAESCELIMALLATGDRDKALEIFGWLQRFRQEDGSWWTGYVFTDKILWPEERPTWTAGAVLLAADALTDHTAASRLFTSPALIDDH
ncbi:MAG: hypothetical protein KUG75_07480 [Pseudomonadales bacterium]|nr:hypothetical protein [Pseudomonadales bacterium]